MLPRIFLDHIDSNAFLLCAFSSKLMRSVYSLSKTEEAQHYFRTKSKAQRHFFNAKKKKKNQYITHPPKISYMYKCTLNTFTFCQELLFMISLAFALLIFFFYHISFFIIIKMIFHCTQRQDCSTDRCLSRQTICRHLLRKNS